MAPLTSPSEVKLKYGSLGVRIKNLTQKAWVKASKKLGLCIPEGSGAGSHVAVYRAGARPPYDDSEYLVLTIVKKPYAQIQISMVKSLTFEGVRSGQYTEKDVWEVLGIKVPAEKE